MFSIVLNDFYNHAVISIDNGGILERLATLCSDRKAWNTLLVVSC